MLKDWLVRRRDNPYPSRDEKKALAVSSGLTYIQICNWFANWRRKLKNAGREPAKRTWGNLIKNYNTSANGNVEQFSISSNDSIWGDETATAAAEQQRLHLLPQLVPQQQHFHPDYRPNQAMHYEASGPMTRPADGGIGSQQPTIEYYDRFGELVIRTTAGASASVPPSVPPMILGQQQQHQQSFNIADRGGYFYGYFDSAQQVDVARLNAATAQEQCFQVIV